MSANERKTVWWLGLTMQEAFFAAFLALAILLTRVVFNFHIKVPGHTMLLVVFLLCVGRGTIERPHAASAIAALVGLASLLTGPGKSGPLIFFKMFLPGLTIDLVLLFLPRALLSPWTGALVGGLAGASRMPVQLGIDLLVGMGLPVALAHSGVRTLSGALFAALGGLLAPVVVRRLARSGLLSPRS